MKPFFTLCMVLTVIQVLSVINGVSSDTDPAPASPPAKRPVRRTAPKDPATTPADNPSKKTTTTTTTTSTKTQRQQQSTKKNDQTTPGKRAPKKPDADQQQPAADDADDADGPLPTDVAGAGLRLAKTARQEASRRAAGLVNGGTGLLRMGSGLMGLLGGMARRQTDNVRKVTREGFEMANGLGDSAGRGAVRVMRNTAGVGRDVAGRMGDVADATAATGKKFSRLGGAAAVTPISLVGDAVDLGTAAVTIPKNASKKVTGFVTQTVLPRLGADKMTAAEDDNGGDRPADDQVEEAQDEEQVVVDDADADVDVDATQKQAPSS